MEIIRERIDAVYARQSIDKPDSISIESQIEFCRYETRGAPCEVFWDKGYSGKNTDRPGFQKMLHEIRSGHIRRVICYKLDRCSRSILDFTALIDEFQKYGVEFVSCTERFDTSTPIGRAMLNICIVFAQLERETIQQRVTDAYHSRSKKGFYMGGRRPFGYRLVPCTIENRRTSCYEADPNESEIIKFMYVKYADPTASLGDVILALENAAIKNPRRADGLWVRSHVGRMLANPIYVKADINIYNYFEKLGVIISNPRDEFIGLYGCYLYKESSSAQSLVLAPHSGIVDSEIWLSCQKKHTTHNRAVSQKQSGTWISGKIKCACCENSAIITVTTKKSGKKYRYIVCPNSHGSNRYCIGIRGWKPEMVESIVEKLILHRLKTEFRQVFDEKSSYASNGSTLSEELLQIQKNMESLSKEYEKSEVNLIPQVQNSISYLYRKKMDVLLQIKKRARQQASAVSPDYDKLWKTWSTNTRFQILNNMAHWVYLSENKLYIRWRF